MLILAILAIASSFNKWVTMVDGSSWLVSGLVAGAAEGFAVGLGIVG